MKIIVKSEIGREVNPKAYQKFFCDTWTKITNGICIDLTKCDCEEYRLFEQSVTTYPAPGLEDGEFEADLQWQENWVIEKQDSPYWINVKNPNNAYETRQVYRLSPAKKEVEVKSPEQQLLDQPKEQVIERQFKNNCDYGFKQRNVNAFIRLAFESGFENGMNYQKYSNHPDTK